MATASATTIFLTCVGWHAAGSGIMTHSVEWSGAHALFDGKPYSVTSTSTDITLHSDGKTVGELLKMPGKTIVINRLTGTFLVQDMADMLSDWTRDNDPGCVKVARKF